MIRSTHAKPAVHWPFEFKPDVMPPKVASPLPKGPLDKDVALMLGFVGVGLGALAITTALIAKRFDRLTTPNTGRGRVMHLIQSYCPSDWGDERFDEILGGKIGPDRFRYYQKGYGTTCAIFAAFILWKAGADPSCINRGETFRTGAHAEKIFQCARARNAFRTNSIGLKTGDFFYVSDSANPSLWHVGFVWELGEEHMTTADGGQTNQNGDQCVRFVRRRIRRDAQGRLSLSGPDGYGGYRAMNWNVNIDLLFN